MRHEATIIEVLCQDICVAERHRKDMGDLEGLAQSIAAHGLLQPIGITEDHQLVFGERRLLAVRDLLKWPTISARVVHVASLLAAEYDENELHKAFTPSERVAIAQALEAEIGNRQGRRTDLGPVENSPQVPPGVKSRELVAEKAGFGSTWSYEQAKKVVEAGVPELVDAMDAGEVSISAASLIAQQPPEAQRHIVQVPAELRREIVRQLRDTTELPSTAEARRLARETGMLVADRTGRYRSWATAEERAATKADLDAIWAVTRAVLALADTPLDPVALASRLEYWHCPGIRAKSPVALDWLRRFEEAIRENTQIS
ncbi:MAG: ParB/RepB/Spo0J family partition protein [Acidobacteriota bacterium]